MAAPAHPTNGNLLLGPAGPGMGATLLVPDDATDVSVPPHCRGLYVTGAGDIHCIGIDGTDFTMTILANTFVPIAIKRLKATGTTATNVFAIW